MKLAIDGDIFAYQHSATRCGDLDFGDEVYKYEDWDLLIQDWPAFVGRLPKSKETVVCFSGGNNFRKKVCPTYKANRVSEKPSLYSRYVEWIKQNYTTMCYEGLEADDLIGILVSGHGFTSVSTDKDMKTIPGWHYDLKANRVLTVTQDAADTFWMTQTLTGDAVDGYSGCRGIGPKKAEKLLKGARNLKELWERVIGAYRAIGLTEQDALVQSRLARILRHGDYDFDTKEVKLWEPPNSNLVT